MELAWSQLREEANRLAADIGRSGREHHSLAKNSAMWAAIRAQGVPAEHREWVWPILLHEQARYLSPARNQKLQRQGSSSASYNQLLDGLREEFQEKTEADASSSLEQAQEVAMERFEHLNPFQERKIKRILLAYAKSKDAFYYCHGMVEMCVVLSTFMVEDDAFWSFRLLLEVLLPKYYDESVVDFHTDCLVLQELLHIHDPALSDHMARLGVSIQLLCTKWFFSFFAESMPFDLVCRLYDVLFVDICSHRLSSKIIFSASLAVLLYLSSALVEIQDPSVVLDIISEFCWTTLSEYSVAESFLDLILFVHDHIEDDELATLRCKYRAQLAQEEEQRKSLQRKMQTNTSSSKKLKLDQQGDSEQLQQPRRGRIQSIRLLIQWRKHMIDDSDPPSSEQRSRNSSRTSDEDAGNRTRRTRSSRTRSRGQECTARASDDEGRDEGDGETELEIVTTPSEKEMLAKVYQGISRINRRRSRTSSTRSFSLRGNDGSLHPLSTRSLSLSNSVLSTTSSTKEGSDQTGDYDAEAEPEDEGALWERLRVSGTPEAVARHSMGGVPDGHRKWVWPILIRQISAPSDLPRNLAAIRDEDNGVLLDREIAKSIENDISRTRNLKNGQLLPMRRVLTAFANRNRRVGYCQGMNEILVVLLQYLDEDQALGALVLLIEVLLPAYHVDSMIGLHTDCAVMNSLLRQNDAELHAHLNELGLNMEILCTKWLVTCFLTSLPVFCGLKVIDMLLARTKEKQCASRVLLGVGISIFFTLRDILLEAKDAGEVLLAINEYFAREMVKTTVEMDKFLHFCQIIIGQLEPEIVEEIRLVHKDEVMERFAAFEAKKIEMRQQLEEAKAKQRKTASAPPSPSKPDRLSTHSASGGLSKPNGHTRISGLSSYISNPLRGGGGGSKTASTASGDEKESRKDLQRYQRVDILEANRGFGEDLVKMEDQLEDLADLFLRGKIDEKEHSCIRAQIVRKWCKGMNSPQSAMVRVRSVKHMYGGRGGETRMSFTGSASGSLDGPARGSFVGDNGEAAGGLHGKKGSTSLYGRMKKAQKSALAIFKSTFE